MPRFINITFVDGDRNGESVSVPFDAPFTAGRDGGDAVRFREKAVSRGHFTVTPRGMRAEIVNNGKNPTEINGRPLAKGETCTAGPGDTLMVRYPSGKSGFRIDSITNGADDGEIAADSRIAADATVAYPAAGLTKQTAFGSSVMDVGDASGAAGWSRSVNSAETAKDETRMEDAGFTEAAPSGSGFGGSAAGYDAPTRAEAGTGSEDFEKITGPAEPADSETVNLGDSPSGTGVTKGLNTVFLDANVIGEEKKRWERKKRTRRRLLAFAVLGFAAFIGAIVWIKWPKTELRLEWPVKPGAEKAEFDCLEMRGDNFFNASSNTNEQHFLVEYPVCDGYVVKKLSVKGIYGYEVQTFVGKDGSVPCRIRVEKTVDAEELWRSPGESAEAVLEKLKDPVRGFTVYTNVPDWGSGWSFIENESQGSFSGELPYSIQSHKGMKYYRCEYERTDAASGEKWRGALILFRRADERYAVFAEIPESEWARGKHLMRSVAYPVFAPSFFKKAGKEDGWPAWESPGAEAMKAESGMKDSELLKILRAGAADRRNWPVATRAANALLARSWKNPEKIKVREETAVLLRRLEMAKESFYNAEKNAFDGCKPGSKAAKDVRDAVENAFKFDAGSDRRAEIVNDPEVWPCGKSRKKQ